MNRTEPPLHGILLGDRYLLDDLLGEGAFARTYRARDNRLERVVAIKVLRPRIAADPAFLSRFQQEARAAARIDHFNVVQVYDSGEGSGSCYLVMQYVPGRDLKQYTAEQAPLPPAEAIRIARDILNGLTAVHRAGIIHRDIKPQNVLLGWDGIARVTDFGIALEGNQPRLSLVTEDGTTFGTPAYMAPEQARGEPVTEATDIYAAGVLLFEMLTGHLPFKGETQLSMMVAHVEQTAPSPSATNPAVPPDLDVITLRAMAKAPGQRFASAADMEQSLANALRNLAGTGGQAIRPSSPPITREYTQHAADTFVTPKAPALPVSVPVAPRRIGARRWIIPVIMLTLAGGILAATLSGALDLTGETTRNSETPRPAEIARGNAGDLRPLTRTPEQTGIESSGGQIIERVPTDVTEPTVEEPDGGLPTIAPADDENGGGIVDTVEPGGGSKPVSLAFSATDWEGGVTRGDSDFLGRAWTAIYGAPSGASSASLTFSLGVAPAGDATMVITGVNDESGDDSPISITVNGVELYSGFSPFDAWDGGSEDAPWTDFALTVPGDLLRAGSNEIAVSNLNPVGDAGAPPYVLLAEAIVDFG